MAENRHITALRPRFGLRALLVLFLLAAGGLGWAVKRVNEQEQVIHEIEELGGFVTFHHDFKHHQYSPIVAWLRPRVGDKWFRTVHTIDLQSLFTLTDDQMPHIERLPGVERLYLDDTDVGDDTLAMTRRMPEIEMLFLMDTNVTDDGLEHLRGLRQLRYLSLQESQVTELPAWLTERDDLTIWFN